MSLITVHDVPRRALQVLAALCHVSLKSLHACHELAVFQCLNLLDSMFDGSSISLEQTPVSSELHLAQQTPVSISSSSHEKVAWKLTPRSLRVVLSSSHKD